MGRSLLAGGPSTAGFATIFVGVRAEHGSSRRHPQWGIGDGSGRRPGAL